MQKVRGHMHCGIIMFFLSFKAIAQEQQLHWCTEANNHQVVFLVEFLNEHVTLEDNHLARLTQAARLTWDKCIYFNTDKDFESSLPSLPLRLYYREYTKLLMSTMSKLYSVS